MRFLLFLLLFAADEGRIYHPVTVAQLAAGRVVHTHVVVAGRVALVKTEADGDTHIRIEDQGKFIVAECIPALPCARPRINDRVKVSGITRFDHKHGWAEVHPVENLEVVK